VEELPGFEARHRNNVRDKLKGVNALAVSNNILDLATQLLRC
jgi:hypothetical protein